MRLYSPESRPGCLGWRLVACTGADHRQQQTRPSSPAAVYGMRAGKARRRPVARIVVEEPARPFLHAGLARALEVLALQRECEPVAGRKREARRPDLEVHFVDFTGFQLLRFVVRVPGLPFGGAPGIEL